MIIEERKHFNILAEWLKEDGKTVGKLIYRVVVVVVVVVLILYFDIIVVVVGGCCCCYFGRYSSMDGCINSRYFSSLRQLNME